MSTVRVRVDSSSLDLIQSEILESLEDKHITNEVHINETVIELCFGLMLLTRILFTVF